MEKEQSFLPLAVPRAAASETTWMVSDGAGKVGKQGHGVDRPRTPWPGGEHRAKAKTKQNTTVTISSGRIRKFQRPLGDFL